MTAIIKPVGNFCNLRCDYCFYANREQSKYVCMTNDLLEKFMKEYFEFSYKNNIFIWHGGEPLLAGISFYEKVIFLQNKYGKDTKILNLIQTNATIIDKHWAKFFKKYDFRVGVSIDGCEQSHNAYRKYADNTGSFRAVLKGIKILQKYGVNIGYIQTLTRTKINFLKQDFNFFYNELKAKHWAINPYLDLQKFNTRIIEQDITDDMWYSYCKEIFKNWLKKNDSNLIIREIETLIQGAYGKRVKACRFNGSCGNYFCVEADGLIYPCDRFIFLEYLWGDLKKQNLTFILNGDARKNFIEQTKVSLKYCGNCQWIGACNNGCAHHRVGGINGKFYYCNSMKKLFSETQKLLQENLIIGGPKS